MTQEHVRFWLTLMVATSASAWGFGGCLREVHRLGDAPTDAGDHDTGLRPNLTSDTGTGGIGPVADGGRAASPSADASPEGATVVSLGDVASVGWPLQIAPEEVARRLSQLVLRKAPSAALTAAVLASAPRTNQDVGQLTDGLMLNEGSLAGRRAFYTWWLSLDEFSTGERDPAVFPMFTSDVRQALIEQAIAFIEDVTSRPQGDLATLLTEPAAFVTTATAPWFPGVVVPAGPGATRVSLDPLQFAGLITQPAVPTIYDYSYRADPTMRGMQVRRTYLCQDLTVDFSGERTGRPPVAGASIRQSIASLSMNPGCASCHGPLDPVGFAFGHFDAVGAYHDSEGGLGVDTTGTLWSVGSGGVTSPSVAPAPTFDGPPALAALLAMLPEVRSCFAAKWLLFATGQAPEAYNTWLSSTGQGVTFQADMDYMVKRATIAGRLHLRGVIRALTETHTFLDP